MAFAKRRQRLDHAQKPARVRAGFHPAPGLLRINDIRVGVRQDAQFFLQPAFPPVLFQLPGQFLVDSPQMGDIGNGICLLRIGERTTGPIRKA